MRRESSFFFTVKPYQGEGNIIGLYCGTHQVAERIVSDAQIGYLLDHCLIMRYQGGPYQLVLPLEEEEKRCCRMEDYCLMQKGLEEKQRYGSKLTDDGGRLQKQARVPSLFPHLQLCCDRRDCSHILPRAEDAPSGLADNDLSLPNQKRTLSLFPHIKLCCCYQTNPHFLPQQGEPHLERYWQEIAPVVEGYQKYHHRCCEYNRNEVKRIAAQLFSQVTVLSTEEFHKCYKDIEEIFDHAEFWGVDECINAQYKHDVKIAMHLKSQYYSLRDSHGVEQGEDYGDAVAKLLNLEAIDKIQSSILRQHVYDLRAHSVGRGVEESEGGEETKRKASAPEARFSHFPTAYRLVLTQLWEALGQISAGTCPENHFPVGFEALLQQAEQLIKQSSGQPYHQQFQHSVEEVFKATKQVFKRYWKNIKHTMATIPIPYPGQPPAGALILFSRQLEKALETWPEGGYKREVKKIQDNMRNLLMAKTLSQQFA